jgi:hypothetical protein
MPEFYETREVLAGAYRAGLPGTMLRHAVEVDEAGHAVRVLCNRVALDSLADRNAGDPHDEPTCRACLRVAGAARPGWDRWYAAARAEMAFRYGRRRVPEDRYREEHSLGSTPTEAVRAIHKQLEATGRA